MRINATTPSATMRFVGVDRKQTPFLEFGLRNQFTFTARDLGALQNVTILLWFPRKAIAAVEIPRFAELREIQEGFQVAVNSDGFELLVRPGTFNPKVTIRDNETRKHTEPKTGQVIVSGSVRSMKFMDHPFDLISPGPVPDGLFETLLNHLGAYIDSCRSECALLDVAPEGTTVVYYGHEPPQGMKGLEIYVCPQGGKKIRLPDNPAFRDKVFGRI